MFRVLQLHKSIRRFTSVGSNVAKINTNLQRLRCYSSAVTALKEETPTHRIQNVLLEIQTNLKQYGRITNKQVWDLRECVAQTDRVNATQALAAVRCFTDLSIDMKPEERIKNVEALWSRLEQLCVHLEVGHYNALLRAYLDSEHNFNPTDFLAKMAENGVGPNRITYQFLVERYCQTGDVNGATRIMRFMEEKQVPITQNVLNLMIMGHARNNDMEKAKDVINVMKSKNLTPDETTYGLLLSEHARIGDVDSIVAFFKNEENRDIFLDSRTVSNIIFQLVSNNHVDSVSKVLESAPIIIQSEFHRLIHRLVSSGYHEACIPLLEQAKHYPEPFLNRLGDFVVSRYAANAKTAEDVLKMINVVPNAESGTLHLNALRSVLANGEIGAAVGLVAASQKNGTELRPHCLFPLVARLAKENNIKELARVILSLKNKVSGAEIYTLYKILKTAGWKTQPAIDALLPVRRYGVTVRECLISSLILRQPGEARELSSLPLRSVIQCTNILVSTAVLRGLPANSVVDVSCNIIARGIRDAEDSESESETSEIVDATAPETTIEDSEDKNETNIPYRKLMQCSPQELADFIISNVVRKVQAESRCLAIFEDFESRGVGITPSLAEELIAKTNSERIQKSLQKLASTKLDVPEVDFNRRVDANIDILEEYLKMEELSDLKDLLQNKLLVALAEMNDMRAVDLMREIGDKIDRQALGAFVRFACNKDSALGLECWEKYSKKKGVSLYFVNLANKLLSEGKTEEALAIISEKKGVIKERPHFRVVQNLLVLLNTSSDERCKTVLEELVKGNKSTDRGLYVGHLNMLLRNEKFVEAVDLFENSVAKFGRYGVRNLGAVLVEKEKYELLQRVQNILTSQIGEEESLYELSLVLLKCRKVRQAKRIIELSSQPGRVINRVLIENDLASLESLAEVLPPFHSKRDELCEKLLEIYDAKNDAEHALALWTRLEEDGATPSAKFLNGLKFLLVRCGYEVPFDTNIPTGELPQTTESNRPVRKTAERIKGAVTDPEPIVWESLDKDRDAFYNALGQLDVKKKHTIVDDLIRKAIEEKNFDRLAFVLPGQQKARFDIFLRFLADDSLRQSYVELMEAHVEDMTDLLRAYWFDAFLKNDEKTCDDLWLKYSLYNMIYPPKFRTNILKGHEERYWDFFNKIKSTPEAKVGAFVAVANKKLAQSVETAVEFLEKETDMITRVHAPTLEKWRRILTEKGASTETSNKFEELVKQYGINVADAPSS